MTGGNEQKSNVLFVFISLLNQYNHEWVDRINRKSLDLISWYRRIKEFEIVKNKKAGKSIIDSKHVLLMIVCLSWTLNHVLYRHVWGMIQIVGQSTFYTSTLGANFYRASPTFSTCAFYGTVSLFKIQSNQSVTSPDVFKPS